MERLLRQLIVVGLAGCLVLALQIAASPGADQTRQVEDFETGDLSQLPWETGGSAPWYVTSSDRYEGSYAARAGSIGDGRTSWLEITLNVTGTQVSFSYKVSSEEGYDYLGFYIDGEGQDGWSGETGWQQATFPVTPGLRTLSWEYSKDGSASSGSDTAWLDAISFGGQFPGQAPGQPLAEMVLVPVGSFRMGDSFSEGDSDERPVHTVTVSAFYMDRYEVTKALWDEVAAWAQANGYDLKPAGGSGKALNHPVYDVSWYEAVKWANARSEREGLTPCYYTDSTFRTVYRTGTVDVKNEWVKWTANGYQLPTEAEWEKAARGGCDGRRFPWCDADTITHSRANYYSSSEYSYDTSPTRGYHPTYKTGSKPYTSPVGSFAPNGYGLYDMAGNVWEWCWDWYGEGYYAASPGTDPRGPASGAGRVRRGGTWIFARLCRVADRGGFSPDDSSYFLGFRLVRIAP